MTNTLKPYDERRNLDEHTALPLKKGRDCTKCAEVTCLFNETSQKALRALEENPMTNEIAQYTCDDMKEDPIAAKADLRELDEE